MKRAIYLDARERDLTRRLLRYATGKINDSGRINGGAVEVACKWTRDEAYILLDKFEEPEQADTVVELEKTGT